VNLRDAKHGATTRGALRGDEHVPASRPAWNLNDQRAGRAAARCSDRLGDGAPRRRLTRCFNSDSVSLIIALNEYIIAIIHKNQASDSDQTLLTHGADQAPVQQPASAPPARDGQG
jgi:hypothetical protein